MRIATGEEVETLPVRSAAAELGAKGGKARRPACRKRSASQIAKPVRPGIYPRQLIPANISIPASINRTAAYGHSMRVCILPIAHAVIAFVIVNVTAGEPADYRDEVKTKAALYFTPEQTFSLVQQTREPRNPVPFVG